jgi:hypothetical protein
MHAGLAAHGTGISNDIDDFSRTGVLLSPACARCGRAIPRDISANRQFRPIALADLTGSFDRSVSSEDFSHGTCSRHRSCPGMKGSVSMTKISVASSATTTIPPLASVTPITVRALSAAASAVEIADVWQRRLDTMVFATVVIADGKNRVGYRKRLATEKAKSVLTMIWTDSTCISDAEIDACGLRRIGSPLAPINCHSLAKGLAPTAAELDKNEKQIQGVVKAAEAFGLVVREPFKGTRQQALRGTEKLHRLMLAVSADTYAICEDLIASSTGDI